MTFEIAIDPTKRCTDGLRACANRAPHIASPRTHDARHTGLEHARFLLGDLREGVAQDALVFQADVRDHRDLWCHDVGRIEATAKPHLEDDDIAPRVPKGLERKQRGVFEERKRRQTRIRAQLLDAIRRVSLGHGTSVDAHALDVSLQVRRGELPRPVPRRAQHRLDHRGNQNQPTMKKSLVTIVLALGISCPLRSADLSSIVVLTWQGDTSTTMTINTHTIGSASGNRG